MKVRYLPLICMLSWTLAGANDYELNPLSDVEADAIVQAEVAARAEREAARPLNQIEFEVLDSREVSRTGASNLIMNRVKPPNIPEAEKADNRDPYAGFSEEELEVAWDYGLTLSELYYIKRTDFLENVILRLSVTVYDRKISRLRWGDHGKTFTAYSNIDFNFMRGVRGFEAGDGHTYYSMLMGIGEAEISGNEHQLPAPGTFDSERAGYVVSTQSSAIPTPQDLAPIDALHAWYQENEDRLKIESQRREALNAAWARHREANPPVERPVVINFWPVEPPRR